jgi:hypothetical protein
MENTLFGPGKINITKVKWSESTVKNAIRIWLALRMNAVIAIVN